MVTEHENEYESTVVCQNKVFFLPFSLVFFSFHFFLAFTLSPSLSLSLSWSPIIFVTWSLDENKRTELRMAVASISIVKK